MPTQKPVVFLAFANDRVDDAAYLRNLPREQEGIRQSLKRAQQAGLCEVVERSNATVKQILDIFQSAEYRGRIAVFHYGGHANGYQLLLETLSGQHASAHSEGLVPFLAGQNSLKLVFLNGCSSQQQAEDLIRAGVPAVIGTSQSINDDVATQLALRFYGGLGEGLSIEKSWHAAVDEVKIEKGTSNMRDLFWEGAEEATAERFPWDINFRPGAELIHSWSLPEAADNPLFGLPYIPPTYHLPEPPFLYLKRYKRPEAEVFFGRSYDIRAMYNLVTDDQSPPLVLLYGQSGVGKSSLIDAGFKPRLERSHHIWYLRRDQGISVPELFEQAASLREELISQVLGGQEELSAADREIAKLDNFQAGLEQLSSSYHKDLPDEMKGLLHQMTVELKASRDFYLLKKKRYIRNQKRKQKHIVLDSSLDNVDEMPLLDQWIKLEEVTGKPLIIIVDQLESIFTIPDPKLPNEFEEFVEDVRELFGNPSKLPKGKLVLSYRKEYHPEIEERFKEVQIPRSRLFIKHLERKEVIEVVMGLTQTERTRQQYKLEVEEGLPEIIADDLLEDKESPIAPVLQILLTKMWQMAEQEDGGTRRFTIERYQQLRQEGILMDDFYEQQMEAVKAWNEEAVTSGLALDVMMFHASSLMAADLRSREEIVAEYAENLDVLDPLVEKLMELYLLNGIQVGNEMRTTLAHDTLAAIVFMQYRSSDYPGQRARRILENKVESYNPEDPGSVLDEADLTVVENGHYGMRAWTPAEEELVAKSRLRRKARDRAKARRRMLGIFAVILIAGLAMFAGAEAYRAREEQRRAQASEKAAKTAEKAAKKAGLIAQEEAETARMAEKEANRQKEIAEQEKQKAQTAQEIAQEEAQRAKIAELRAEKEAENAQKARKTAKQKEAEAVFNFRRAEAREVEATRSARKADSLSNIAQTRALALKSINLGSNQDPKLIGAILALNAYEDVQRFGVRQQDKDIYQALRVAWERLNRQASEVNADQGEVELLQIDPEGKFLISSGSAGIIKFWDLNASDMREVKTLSFCQDQHCYLSSFDLSEDGAWLVSSHTDNALRLWELKEKGENGGFRSEKRIIKKSTPIIEHQAMPIASFFIDKERFVSIDRMGEVNYWDVNSTYRPQHKQILEQHVITAAKHPTQPKVLLVTEGNRILSLDLETREVSDWLPSDALLGQTTKLKFSPNGEYLAIGMRNGYIALFEFEEFGYTQSEGSRAYLNEWPAHLSGVTDMAFSPDGKRLASSSYDKTGKLFDLNTLRKGFIDPDPIIDLQYDSWIRATCFSPNGDRFMFGGGSRSISLHETNLSELAKKIRKALNAEIATQEQKDEVLTELTFVLKEGDDYRKFLERALD